MRRRDKAGGKAVRTQRRKTVKRRNAAKAVRRCNSPAAGKQTKVAQIIRERDLALEQLAATSGVLKVIRSAFELQPVLDSIVETASRLCDAEFAIIFKLENANYHVAASNNADEAFVKYASEHPIPPGRGSLTGRIALEGKTVHIPDCLADPEYTYVGYQQAGKYRSNLGVPLLREGIPIGVINLMRTVVKPFTDEEIKLVETFADQAVIAIENTRLLNELRQRTDDLTESLEQQTATSEVLQVISSSPGDLRPVFATMLANAVRICEAKFGVMHLYEEGAFHVVAMHNVPPAFAEERRNIPIVRPSPGTGLGRAAHTKQVVQIPDLRTYQTYQEREPVSVAMVELAGARTLLVVPMLKEDAFIGTIAIYRQEVRPFTDKQIALLTNFAAQAVIAIENTRLLNELRQSLEQQTATSEVLQVISSSPGALEPVFNAMLANATHICEAKFGTIFQFDGERFRCMAEVGSPPVFAEFCKQQGSFQPLKGSHLDRIMRTKQVSHTADYAAEGIPSPPVKFGGARSTVDVPMLKDNELVGAFSIYRQEVRPFTDKQIALLTNFAAQAVIAIENARLLNDLNKLNQQLEQRVTDQVSEIERMGRLRRFLPPQVADLIVASGTEKQLESHRREITALFCDLRGFTGFSESSDPEDVMALLREYHAAIGEIINKYGGTLERYAGDGVMVVFNDPIPVDSPALQAVLMAIDMRAAIGTLIEKWRKLGHDIGFGIGIAHGFATLGTIGFEGRFDYAAIGTVSNVASRLCDEAKPGQILISPRVLMAVEDAISVEPVGEFKLKGISRPLATYNVLSAVSAKI